MFQASFSCSPHAIPVCKPFIDRLLKFGSTVKGAAANHPCGDQCEKSFHLVQPRTAGGGEVEMQAGPTFWLEPALDLRALVRTVVVHDQVNILIGGEFPFQVVEEADEFPRW